ncbi:RNA-directed DNA polymerase, eukaryota, Nucleotide-binding alpha-beta plait domain protein [Artemisia annua]|uniref:RNA-directed DNA polymerase, eukaryota, Nucleotide-binding alpha-beta plait domain protein n=1 Tax=Artemisia annua TaxID=35608 RepID=A0A2U1L0H1_ARTAN|nr:RNA-directed DNA polymerase, eukaryota, Nucleotide-binding alpha-beta plait domain protein [Artemisia annua]
MARLSHFIKGLKYHLRQWYSQVKVLEGCRKKEILVFLKTITKKIDAVSAIDEDRELCIEKLESLDLIQKVRVKWEVQGDENSMIFHGMINSRRKTQMIQGIMHEGVWITDPTLIKLIFPNFYKDKFNRHDSLSLCDMDRDYLESMCLTCAPKATHSGSEKIRSCVMVTDL